MMPSEGNVHLCSELVELYVGPFSEDREAITANLEEISEGNLELNSEQAVEPGSRVEVHCQFHVFKGVVETVVADALLGHFLRIRLDPESRWSEKLFTPQHLFALWKQVEAPKKDSAKGCAA